VLQEAEQVAPPANGTELGDEISMVLVDLFLEKYKPEAADDRLGARARPGTPRRSQRWAAYLDQFARGRPRTAEEALQINPENADAHAVLAWVALIEGNRGPRADTSSTTSTSILHHGGQIVLAALAIFDRDNGAMARRDAVLGFDPRVRSALLAAVGSARLPAPVPRRRCGARRRCKLLPTILTSRRVDFEAAPRRRARWPRRARKAEEGQDRARSTCASSTDDRIEPHYAERVEGD
jgi:hypothetical protein